MAEKKRKKKGLIFLGMPKGYEGNDSIVLKDSGNRAATSRLFIVRHVEGMTAKDVERFVKKIYMKGGGKLTKTRGLPGTRGFENFTFPVLKPECWLWKGGKDKDDYGRFSLNGKMVQAHILAYALFREPMRDETKELHHECNTRNCVNPNHLTLVDHQENCEQRERDRKGIPVEGVEKQKRPRRIRAKKRANLCTEVLNSLEAIIEEVTGSVGPVDV